MKTNHLISILFILLVIGCKRDIPTKIPYDTHAVILIDITDPMAIYPSLQQVLPIIQNNTDIWAGIKVETGVISDIGISPSQTTLLEKEISLYGNSYQRRAKVNRWQEALAQTLNSYQQDSLLEKNRTVVFIPILAHLKKLVQSSALNKQLLVYSNLMENSTFSFYNPQTLRQLKSEPDKITRQLLQNDSIPDLTGITIYLCYQPLDYKDAHVYATVSQYFKRLFEANGATVILSAGTQTQTF